MAEAMLQMVVYGLVNPIVALPSFVIGWVVRRWWLVPVGALAIAAVLLIVNLLSLDASDGAEIAWAAVPLTVLPPLAWGTAGFGVGRWYRRHAAAGTNSGAILAVGIVAGLILGAVAGAAAGFGIGVAYVTVAEVSSFEGLAGYVAVFLFGLPGLLIGAVAGAAIGAAISRRLAARRSAVG